MFTQIFKPTPISDQVVTVAEMHRAEQALIDGGISVEALMERAGRGAGEYVWRIAAGARVTVLCGPGNNGGDGWVIARHIRERGGRVQAVMAAEPATAAARHARAEYGGDVCPADEAHGELLVDCLYGSGLSRPLGTDDMALLTDLAARHPRRIAVDVPSGIDADTGQPLNQGLPDYALTLALGAWKPAHFTMPASATMGALRLVDIGIREMSGAATLLGAPHLAPPSPDAHKYTRGLLGIVAGQMPGAAILAATAAQRAGAGYVKLLGDIATVTPPDLVAAPLDITDPRFDALLIGPGLGRDQAARDMLQAALKSDCPLVLDADALMLLRTDDLTNRTSPIIATPHEGELRALCASYAHAIDTNPIDLARASGMVIVAKGPNTVIASPDGRLAFSPRANPWLSTAGTGDVLAGTIASRLATGANPWVSACQGVWLHAEPARSLTGPFTASQLAIAIGAAYAAAR